MARLKAAQRREQLIGVATKLFAKTGYDATTTADIAKAAGVTEPILYRHFESKQELFVAIVRDVSATTMKGCMSNRCAKRIRRPPISGLSWRSLQRR